MCLQIVLESSCSLLFKMDSTVAGLVRGHKVTYNQAAMIGIALGQSCLRVAEIYISIRLACVSRSFHGSLNLFLQDSSRSAIKASISVGLVTDSAKCARCPTDGSAAIGDADVAT